MSDANAIYIQAANGNPLALDFIIGWNDVAHRFDDVIDAKEKKPEDFLKALMMANALYSTDFFQAHYRELGMAVELITNAYADSLHWENHKTRWKRQWGDVLRFAGAEMVIAVATICGGPDIGRKISLQLRELVWRVHHDGNGKPT